MIIMNFNFNSNSRGGILNVSYIKSVAKGLLAGAKEAPIFVWVIKNIAN